MFDIVTATPGSAVATSGTIEFAFPAGKSAGHYASFGHKAQLHGLMNGISQDAGEMSLAFTTVITMTYRGATSIPAGSLVTLQANMRGQDDALPFAVGRMKREVPMLPVRIELGAPDTSDADGIAESQSVAAAAEFVLNGVYADPYAGAKAVLDVPRAIVGAWTTDSVITVTGKDEYGDVIVESNASAAVYTGKKAFKVIDSMTSSASITAATFGTGEVLGLPVFVPSATYIWQELKDDVPVASFGSSPVLVPFEFTQTDLLAGTAADISSPIAGYITGMQVTVELSVTTGGAITVEANTVAVVGLSVTVADAAAAGTVYTDTVLKIATGLVAAGDDITVTPAAAFATQGTVTGFLIIEPTTVTLDGTFVAGVQTTPTATTGDTKGTYDPSELANGALQFALIAMLPDPTYKGVDNYDG